MSLLPQFPRLEIPVVLELFLSFTFIVSHKAREFHLTNTPTVSGQAITIVHLGRSQWLHPWNPCFSLHCIPVHPFYTTRNIFLKTKPDHVTLTHQNSVPTYINGSAPDPHSDPQTFHHSHSDGIACCFLKHQRASESQLKGLLLYQAFPNSPEPSWSFSDFQTFCPVSVSVLFFSGHLVV